MAPSNGCGIPGRCIRLREALDLLLERAPQSIDVKEVEHRILAVPGVQGVHHIHIWSLDGHKNCITLHVVSDAPAPEIKGSIRQVLSELGLNHATIETERVGEECAEVHCKKSVA